MLDKLLRSIAVAPGGASKREAREIAGRADHARDSGKYADAAVLFEEALRLRPGHAGWRIQAGHMRKETREYAAAEAHYLAALALRPEDPDLALQMGHFYKVTGALDKADAHYRRAAELKPDWAPPLGEAINMKKDGWIGESADPAALPPRGYEVIDTPFKFELQNFADPTEGLARAVEMRDLVPQIVPRRPQDLLHTHSEIVEAKRLGRRENGFWGMRRTLRGVEAVRGVCVSRMPIVDVEILLNGMRIHRSAPKGGYTLKFEREKDNFKKYVFNIWHDFVPYVRGLHAIEIRCTDLNGRALSFHDHVVIADDVEEADAPHSDARVSIDRNDPRSVDEQIRTRPSMIRDAKRERFPDGIHNVLILRTDQLGDMVASIPAMRRLRELLPDANFVGLLTGANADFARTLDLFDEIIVIEFPDDPTERRRLMPLDVQEELRDRLAPYHFDIALDLAQSNVSRDLLQLAGAKFTYGTGGGDWPWMSGEIIFNTPDRWNGLDTTPHSTKVLGLVEALGAILRTSAPVLRRDDLPRSLLEEHGIGADDRFAVLHAGARVEFSRWPYFPQLATMLLERTDLKIVLMTEEAAFGATLPPELLASDRFLFLDQRLTFDMFDAFISYATVVVGNDSGPKHLASLRGTNVVTLFTARINWNEWAQENVGAVMTRRVPCTGCLIFHDMEDCGKDFACIRDIKPEEVLETALRYV